MNYNDLENTIGLEEIQNVINSDKLIKNESLERYVKFIKAKSTIEKNDLNDINEIILDSKTVTGERNIVIFEEINLFENLERLKICNLGIYEKTIDLINEQKKLNDIYFENCNLTHIYKLEKIKKLHLCNTVMEDYNEIGKLKFLEELKLENVKIEKFDFISNISSLKNLYLLNVNENAIDLLPELKNIEFLSISGINWASKEKLAKFSNLKALSIDKSELEKHKELIAELEEGNIKLLVEDTYEYL